MSPQSFERTPAQMGIIRMALLGGVLLFGVVTWFLHRQPGWVPVGGMEKLRPIIPLIMLAFIAAIVGIRIYLSRVSDLSQLPMLQLLAWTLGEAAGLLGGVYYYTTDDARFFIIGLFVMVASFIVVPLRRS